MEFVIKTLVVKLSVDNMERPPDGSLYTSSPSVIDRGCLIKLSTMQMALNKLCIIKISHTIDP